MSCLARFMIDVGLRVENYQHRWERWRFLSLHQILAGESESLLHGPNSIRETTAYQSGKE
jgi:hypothetical protein